MFIYCPACMHVHKRTCLSHMYVCNGNACACMQYVAIYTHALIVRACVHVQITGCIYVRTWDRHGSCMCTCCASMHCYIVMHTCMHVSIYSCTCVMTLTPVYGGARDRHGYHTYTYMYASVCTYIYTHHSHVFMPACMHIHTYIHT
jgi:hypothetical protein